MRRVQVVIGPDMYHLVKRLYADVETLPQRIAITIMWAITLGIVFIIGYGVCLTTLLVLD